MTSSGNLKNSVDPFIKIVGETFRFLEKEYGYVQCVPEKRCFPGTQTIAVVGVTYVQKTLGIRIEWHRVDAQISIVLIELDHGQIPEKYSPFYGHKGYARAISLRALMAVVTDETVKDPLPETPGPKSRYINKIFQQRKKRIEEDMAEVLQTYASWLQEYASDILHGDTSSFPAVQRYSRKKLERQYEEYGHPFPKEQYED